MVADKALQDLLLEMLDREYFQTTTHLVERVTDNGVIMWRLASVSGGLSP
ncbi:MAG: hypothetical protein KGZ79_01690 [Dethiobacter sp.]|jgi:hypothetical protein|nr:hypothetical protein [Dethiobacter sp.]